MQQTYETRGKLALIEDQVDGAVEAFRAGMLADVEVILKSLPALIDDLLGRPPTGQK